jgi:hypothetical protein
MFRFPTTIFVQKLNWYIKMVQVHDWPNALFDELVNDRIVKSNRILIERASLQIVNQTCPWIDVLTEFSPAAFIKAISFL